MLSVTVFLVAINSILGELGIADNLAIYITTRNRRVAARALQGVTKKLDIWAAERGLKFSPNKTISMIFRKRNEKPLEIMMRNEIIPSKECTQFLGMTQDSRLNWKEHINKLRAKAKRTLNTIKVVAGRNGDEIEKP